MPFRVTSTGNQARLHDDESRSSTGSQSRTRGLRAETVGPNSLRIRAKSIKRAGGKIAPPPPSGSIAPRSWLKEITAVGFANSGPERNACCDPFGYKHPASKRPNPQSAAAARHPA